MDYPRLNKKYKRPQPSRKLNSDKMKTITPTRKSQLKDLPSSTLQTTMRTLRMQICFLTSSTRLLKKKNRQNSGQARQRFEIPPPATVHQNPALLWDRKWGRINKRSLHANPTTKRSQSTNHRLTNKLPEIQLKWRRLTSRALRKVWALQHMSLSTTSRWIQVWATNAVGMCLIKRLVKWSDSFANAKEKPQTNWTNW